VLVPELTLANPGLAATALETLGFASDGGLWRLGSQALRLVGGNPAGHGRIDHVALAVPDLDWALGSLTARGATLADVTPDGPRTIPEFWDDGLRYVYLEGPEGARIELCQRLSGAATAPGQDHIGIPCTDLAAMLAFFQGQGARPVAAVDLARPEGVIPVRFLSFHSGMVELFRPARPARVERGLWSRLLIGGLAAPVAGPEGLALAPL
jgi:catechol 2,3-dioxygenase-like lactoylglutathione lyase family enzyme